MGRPKRAVRTSVAVEYLTVRTTENLLAALDAAVSRVAQDRAQVVTRTDFVLEAVLQKIGESGVRVANPGVPQPSLPGLDAPTQNGRSGRIRPRPGDGVEIVWQRGDGSS